MNLSSKAKSMVELSENLTQEFAHKLPELYEMYPEFRPDQGDGDEIKAAWREEDHPRADNGEFGSGAAKKNSPTA